MWRTSTAVCSLVVLCIYAVESSWNVMAHGDAWEGKWRGNWRMELVAVLFTLPWNMEYPAILPLMCTPRLPVVDWTDTPADLNGLVHFAKRQNLVSARVPSHFKCSLYTHQLCCYCCCHCAIAATITTFYCWDILLPPLTTTTTSTTTTTDNTAITTKNAATVCSWSHTYTHTSSSFYSATAFSVWPSLPLQLKPIPLHPVLSFSIVSHWASLNCPPHRFSTWVHTYLLTYLLHGAESFLRS